MEDTEKTKEQLTEERAAGRQREQQIQENATRSAIIRRVREAIWGMQQVDDIHHVRQSLVTGLQQLGIPFQGLGINVLTGPPGDPTGMTYHQRNGDGTWTTTTETPWSELNLKHIMEAGGPVYRRDLEAEDKYGEAPIRGYGFVVRSVVDVPFSLGTLAVNSPEPDAFSPEVIDILQDVAPVLGEGFVRIVDLERLEGRAREVESLASAIAVVSSTHQLEEMLRAVVLESTRMLSTERATLFLFDEGEGALTPRAQVGHDWSVYRHVRLRPGEDMSGQVYATGQPFLIDPDGVAAPTRRHETTALFERSIEGRELSGGAAVPLRLDDRIIGTLAVGTTHRQLSPRDVEMLERLAEQATLAIDRAQRSEALEQRNRELEAEIEKRTLAQEMSRFQADLLENVRESVIATDLEGRITYLGGGAETLYGYSADEVLGTFFWTVTGSELEEREREALVLAVGEWWGESRRRRKDGTEFWAESVISLVSDQHGKAQGFICTERDTTERKRAEEALRDSEGRFRDLALSMADWVWEVDENGVYTYCTEKVQHLLGYSVDEIIGRTPFDLMPADEAQRIGSIFSDLIALRAPITDLENWNLHRDGQRVCLLTNGVPFFDPQGAFRGYRGTDRDITERKEAGEALMQSSRLIALGQMAAGMAHELNQPLTVISALAEGLQIRLEQGIEMTPERLLTWGEDVLKGVERMSSIIEHLRTFSRDRSEEPHAQVDVNGVVHETLAMVQAQLKSRGVEVALDLSADLAPVLGDQYRLEQVLINLMHNGRDAVEEKQELIPDSDRDSWKMRLAIRTHLAGEQVVVEVEDNGVGMVEETRRQVLEPFFTTKGPDRGTGLGLSISYAIVKDHGGQIECESKAGRGTVFRVRLPILRE